MLKLSGDMPTSVCHPMVEYDTLSGNTVHITRALGLQLTIIFLRNLLILSSKVSLIQLNCFSKYFSLKRTVLFTHFRWTKNQCSVNNDYFRGKCRGSMTLFISGDSDRLWKVNRYERKVQLHASVLWCNARDNQARTNGARFDSHRNQPDITAKRVV